MRPDVIDWTKTHDAVALPFLPRQRMHQTLWRWIVGVIIVQAIIVVAVLVTLQGPWRTQVRDDHAQTIAQLAGEQISHHRIRGNGPAAQHILDELTSRPTILFAAVLNSNDTVVQHGQINSPDWQQYAAAVIGNLPRTEQGHGLAAVDPVRNLLVYEVPLASATGGEKDRLLLGVRDLGARRAVLDGVLAIGVALLAVALVLMPLTYRILRRWTRGMRELHSALRHLALGGEPKPLTAGGEDEVAYLAIAFNDMASQLIASRHALLDANKDLERRVEQRTLELRSAAQKMEKLASSDVLTGLANRRALTTHMQSMFDHSLRNDSDLVCLVVDLDDFKAINDTLGHATGDHVLQVASEVFRDTCRGSDLAARLGGDEFVLLIPVDDMDDVLPIANRLIEQFQTRCTTMFRDTLITSMPSMSIGIASRKQAQVDTAGQLLQAADAALYTAKSAGKGRLELWRQEDHAAVRQRLTQVHCPALAQA